MASTKQARTQSREYQFNILIQNGFKRETYKGLEIFTKDEADPIRPRYLLKVFIGTAAHAYKYLNYRTEKDRDIAIFNLMQSYDRRQTFKAEQKEKNKGKSSSHAAAASSVKSELMTAYPGIKFSVKSDSFSGGNSISIHWEDGPTTKEVEAISQKYQYGHFNGMDDIYEYSNEREDIPQVKYVSESRHMSERIKALLPQIPNSDNYRDSQDQILYRIFAATSLPPTYQNERIERTDTTAGHIDELYKIVFETEHQPTTTPDPTPAPETGSVFIVDYSEKAIAVTGDAATLKAIQSKMYAIGGKWNRFLSCGPGYIFSKKRLDEVTRALQTPIPTPQPEIKPVLALPEPQPEPAKVIPTPQNNYQIESFKIIWHEGRHIEGAIFENTTFYNWEDIQNAFLKLWEVNERHSEGGYTKVKCEIKFLGKDEIITRIDITNRIKNGNFNPSDEHIVSYLQSQEEPEEEEQPVTYNSLKAITQAATTAKIVSLSNLFNLIHP